jgi:hypothetical protein
VQNITDPEHQIGGGWSATVISAPVPELEGISLGTQVQLVPGLMCSGKGVVCCVENSAQANSKKDTEK